MKMKTILLANPNVRVATLVHAKNPKIQYKHHQYAIDRRMAHRLLNFDILTCTEAVTVGTCGH